MTPGPRISPKAGRPAFFDGALAPRLRTDHDLENLAYFGATGAVCTFALRGDFDSAQQWIHAIEGEVQRELPRVAAAGLDAAPTCGVTSVARPKRTHRELWAWLDDQLASRRFVGVGILDTAHSDALRIQMELAERHVVPVAVRVRAHVGAAAVDEVIDAAREAGLAAARLVLHGCDYTNIRRAFAAGANVALDVSPAGDREAAVDVVARYEEAAASKVIFAAAGQAPFDVLAMPRALDELAERGVDKGTIAAVATDNTRALYGLGEGR